MSSPMMKRMLGLACCGACAEAGAPATVTATNKASKPSKTCLTWPSLVSSALTSGGALPRASRLRLRLDQAQSDCPLGRTLAEDIREELISSTSFLLLSRFAKFPRSCGSKADLRVPFTTSSNRLLSILKRFENWVKPLIRQLQDNDVTSYRERSHCGGSRTQRAASSRPSLCATSACARRQRDEGPREQSTCR